MINLSLTRINEKSPYAIQDDNTVSLLTDKPTQP